MKILVVDDESLARQRLLRLLQVQPDYQVVAEAENGEQALMAYNRTSPDVVLMDIRMPLMDGLKAARALALLEQPPAVIFCTAYSDYAIEAFEANAVGYLLKPVNRDKLMQVLEKASKLNRVQLSTLAASDGLASELADQPQRRHIAAKSARGIELLPIADIRFFLADQKYVTVYYCREGELVEVLIDESLKELEQEFAEDFLRLHRNALVSRSHIQGLERDGAGHRVRLDNVAEGPQVSRRHLPELRQLLQQF